jgi:DNA-binding protein
VTVDKDDLEFSLSQIHRLIKKYNKGEEKRISSDAAEELASVLTIVASPIARQAADLFQHAGRKTIVGSDIRLASKNILKDVLQY